MKTAITLAVLLLLTGCRELNGAVVSQVHGDHLTCVSPASTGYDVYVPNASRYSVGDPCPAGESR